MSTYVDHRPTGRPASRPAGPATPWYGRLLSVVPSLLAALTTWVTLLAWTPFAEHAWGFMGPLLAAVLVVAATGIALRSARLPAVAVAVVQAALLLLWLHHRLAGFLAPGGLLPTPASVQAMVQAVHASAVASQTYAAPVPTTAPEFYPLLILTGSLTAVLVDLLAVGLRRAPLAGLPLLAVYTAPVSVLDGGVSWVKFAAAALCFLFLITAEEDQRLTRWGQQLTPTAGFLDQRGGGGSGRSVWASARKIGVTATALAVVVPALLPTFSSSLFGGGSGGSGNGDGVTLSNPMVDLVRDLSRGPDVDAVTVLTQDPDPSYLRISVLDTFDGKAWRPAPREIPAKQGATGRLPEPPGLLANLPARSVASTIQVSDSFRSRWLPTPYPASFVDAPGDWRYDRSTLDFISADEGQTTAGLRYEVRALELTPTAAELADATPPPLPVFTPNTALPANLSPYVRALATRVTKGQPSRFEQAVALQQFFREDGGFRYSLKQAATSNGTDALLRFLRPGPGGRVGYCEQFAAAMTLMGRTLGIPSRVAVGFLTPERTGADTFVYSTHDLHAWPEMYFGGAGWVRFEPTPSSRAGDVPAYTTQRVPTAQASASASAPSASAPAKRVDRSADVPVPAAAGGGWSLDPLRVLAWVAAGLLVVLLLLAPRALRSLVRRRRWAAATTPVEWVEAAWAELRDTALDLSTAWDDRVTLRTAKSRLAATFGDPDRPDDALCRSSVRGHRADPVATAALDRLVSLLERARYARELPAASTAPEEVQADTALCVAAMRAGAGRRRVRATWLPISLMHRRGGPRVGRRTLLGDQGVDRTVRSGA